MAWEAAFGVAPRVTSAIAELDAARLVGMSLRDYSKCMVGATAVGRGHDFINLGKRYQVKANRPSGRPGSTVTLVPKAKNYNWDYLIWIRYDRKYVIQEAWMWDAKTYRSAFDTALRLSPAHYRNGKRLR